jgi:2-polyprenyl-6-methoxyphenol hydroxylase-like FAD-dependent oxidoreductase
MWECESLARAGEGRAVEVGYPTLEQSAAVSPTSPACVAQDHLESVLLHHLASLPTSRVEFGTEVVDVEQLGVPVVFAGDDRIGALHRETAAGGGVVATLRDTTTGDDRRVWARYLIAADGAHSRVRSLAGISMHGPDNLAGGVQTLFHAPLWEVLDEHRYLLYVVGGEDVILPAGPGDRWLAGTPSAGMSEERVVARLRAVAEDPSLPVRIERIGAFTFAAQLAERFRSGDVFLVGDAAHRVSPRGGTGMNTAIADGHDLGWKLAWVLNGWNSADLLDTYEAERRPIADHNVTRSADPMGSRRPAEQELAVDLGGRVEHVWDGERSTVDMLGSGLTLFAGPRGPRSVAAPHAAVAPLSTGAARALGLDDDEGLLVRPDGVPIGRCRDCDVPLQAQAAEV